MVALYKEVNPQSANPKAVCIVPRVCEQRQQSNQSLKELEFHLPFIVSVKTIDFRWATAVKPLTGCEQQWLSAGKSWIYPGYCFDMNHLLKHWCTPNTPLPQPINFTLSHTTKDLKDPLPVSTFQIPEDTRRGCMSIPWWATGVWDITIHSK